MPRPGGSPGWLWLWVLLSPSARARIGSRSRRASTRYSYPWPAVYARWRAGEALIAAGERAAAAEPLTVARAAADAMGARPLIGEIDALARRARVDVALAEPAAVGRAVSGRSARSYPA